MNKKVIFGGITAVFTIGLITVGIIKATSGGNAIAVRTAEIRKGEISSYTSAEGIVEEVEKAEVFFDTPLKVKEIMVEIGQEVKKGQKLFELDIAALNSQLETLKINRNTQKTSLDSKALDSEVERALNNLKAAERNYNETKKTYEDNKILYDADAISKAELDMSEKAFKEAESGISGLKNARIAFNTAVESRANSKKSGEDNLKVLDIQIRDMENKIDTIIKDCSSPIDGVVASLGVQKGAFTNSMQAAYKVINPDRLQIKAKVKEFDIKNVAAAQKVKITGEAISNGREVNGNVKNISPVAVNSMTSSGNETVVEVLIDVNDSGDILKPGLNVTCEIATTDRQDVLLAPMEALTLDKDDNNMVFVADEKTKTMIQQKVTIGINSDMIVEILDGLKEGDLVVLDPQPSYRDGVRIRISDK